MNEGTFRDKVSSLSIYIRDNPKFSLQTIQNLIEMCTNSSKREALTALNAVKDIFIEVNFFINRFYLNKYNKSLF